MPSVPPLLRSRIRKTLLRCGRFHSNAALHSLFNDERLYPWRHHIPDAPTEAERVDALLDALHDSYNDNGELALALFLTVLAEQFEDACRAELLSLAADLTGSPNPGKSETPLLYTRVPDPRAPRLLGRDTDLEWLCARLKRGDVSALAGVRGLGGIGKTELAIAAARALDDHFHGRVLWLDCGPNEVPAIQERMAAALGVKLETSDPLQRADALALAWRGQPPTLVVLDDVRAAHLAAFPVLLPPRPPCAVLITSRRQDMPLPPGALRRLNVLDPAPSQDLLADLLPDDLPPDPQSAAAVVELLERVPLALTLAARRLVRIAERRRAPDADSPWRVLLREVQERRAQVLDQGDRPDRSVWVAFDLSYADLDPTDQARLRRLGVFARSEFALPALLAVWDDDEPAARDALTRLTDAGLLEEVDDDVWWMHDLLREYALARLAQDAEEVQAARLAHAAYWHGYLREHERLSLADWHILDICRPEIERAADWLLLDNPLLNPWLTAALAFAIDQKFQIYTFPHGENWLRAGMAAAVRMVETPPPDMEKETCQLWLAVTQSSLADLLSTRGQYEEAERLYRESLAVFEAVGDRREVAVTQSSLADLLSTRGQYEEAERL
ncbi:MAG TPA: tetratricopeptide repeat protein, partial [Anaerolineae bacterium]|nr:tetratricopeptide repeat protein [Anaerolineae bacterium]